MPAAWCAYWTRPLGRPRPGEQIPADHGRGSSRRPARPGSPASVTSSNSGGARPRRQASTWRGRCSARCARNPLPGKGSPIVVRASVVAARPGCRARQRRWPATGPARCRRAGAPASPGSGSGRGGGFATRPNRSGAGRPSIWSSVVLSGPWSPTSQRWPHGVGIGATTRLPAKARAWPARPVGRPDTDRHPRPRAPRRWPDRWCSRGSLPEQHVQGLLPVAQPVGIGGR